ncbi:MAG: dihydroneopterin aldolase [Polyangiaceae bacterium]|nr:dihydroneopterin aldolase [Polyangiaceae bacterium]
MSQKQLLDDKGRPLDCISLSSMSIDCIVGVYRHEREEPQPLLIELFLYLDTRPATADAGIEGTVDYARIAGEVYFLLQSCRFRMLEHAANALARYLLAPPTRDTHRAQVQAVTVRLEKPRALPGQAIPALEVTRRASEMHYRVEEKPFGWVDVIHEGPIVRVPGMDADRPNLSICRIRLKSGASIPTHVHRIVSEHEMILGGGLLLQGRPVPRGTAFHWPHEFPRRYDNPTDTVQTLLRVNSPAPLPTDTAEVSEPAEGLVTIAGRSYYPEADRGEKA